MSTGFSAHPVLASDQLRNDKNPDTAKTKAPLASPGSPQRKRHNSPGAVDARRGFFNFSPFRSKSLAAKNAELSPKAIEETMRTTENPSSPQKTLPDRTRDVRDDAEADNKIEQNTKDCVDCGAPSGSGGQRSVSGDEADHRLQHQPETASYDCDGGGDTPQIAPQPTSSTLPSSTFSESCPSGLSSVISSPSVSTVSSPLSTPTRLTTQLHHSHQHCCRKSSPLAAILPGVVSSSASHYQHHHLHHHSHQHHHHNHQHHSQRAPTSPSSPSSSSASSSSTPSNSASGAPGGCKKLQKLDPRFGPSPYRQLLPVILCILSFAAVFAILIIYMDTTEIRHQQFRLNMSRDYDLYGVAQDDPTLIAFLREIHMRKYPMHFLKNHADPPTTAKAAAAAAAPPAASASEASFNKSANHGGLVPEMANYVAGLLGRKVNGATIQSLPGAFGQLNMAPWLAETLNWSGIIVEPDPRRFFTLRKQNDNHPHMQVVHACVSPNPYPKEVTIHNEESDVRINSLLDEETSFFNSRVKCFPLYTIMLACNRVEYDLLSLGVHGHELEILQTLPFDKVKIEVISIHLADNKDKAPRGYIQSITKFLAEKGYKLQKTFVSNYFYQRLNTNRTRKKDILLLKAP